VDGLGETRYATLRLICIHLNAVKVFSYLSYFYLFVGYFMTFFQQLRLYIALNDKVISE
jgi:hypothetical protein